jgi:ribonuclease P protein component
VVVCSKRLGNAVVRNRIRRVYQATIYKIKNNIAKNIDIVVIPRQTCGSSSGLERSLNDCLARLGR